MRTYVDRFHVGTGTTLGPITVFPVWSESEFVDGLTIPRPSNIQVAEQAEPRVDRLAVLNTGREALLIPEGVIFDGGLQTRVVATDAYIAPGATRNLDVRCVEQGRWNGNESGHVVDGRAPLSVVAALRGLGQAGESQEKVWRRVSQLQQNFGDSPTGSLLDLMAKENLNSRADRRVQARDRVKQGRRIPVALLNQIRAQAERVLPGQTGVLIGVGGRPIALEIHGSPDLLKAQLRQVLGAALLDAMAFEARPTSGQRARDFAEEIMFTPLNQTQVRANTQAFVGRGHLADIRTTVGTLNPLTLHMSVLNHRHELALAA
jgi:hypothetical protein